MSKLEELYKTMNSLKKFNLPLDNNLLQAVDELEEEIIKTEVLPSITEEIEPRLRQIKRKLVLVVDYDPDASLSVKLSRKVNISQLIEGKPLSGNVTYNVEKKEYKEDIHRRSSEKGETKGLIVTYKDGTEVCERNAWCTFFKVIKDFGLEKIPQVGVYHYGYNLVDTNERPPKKGVAWQKKYGKYYIYCNLANRQKIRDLQMISDFYHLGWKVRYEK